MRQYFGREGLVLGAEREDFGGDDGRVAKVRVVLAAVLEEPLALGRVVDWEEVADAWVFEARPLVLLLPPVVAVVEGPLRTQ
jgi:hypothetical protein